LITRDKMLALYTTMVKCRRIAAEADRAKQPKTAVYEPRDVLGWEAAITGVSAHLLAGDKLTARQHSRVWTVLHTMHGNSAPPVLNGSGNTKRRAHAQNGTGNAAKVGTHSTTAGDELEEAERAARDFKIAENGRVAVVFSEPMNGQSAWRNRLRAAARLNLPLLIVSGCALPGGDAKAAASRAIQNHASKALACGVPVITVDGNDVLAVYRVAGESIFRARQRRGPTLIECVVQAPATSTPEDCRQPGIVDPILTMETYLTEKGILTASLKSEIERGATNESKSARAR